jgi:hypothetical protein
VREPRLSTTLRVTNVSIPVSATTGKLTPRGRLRVLWACWHVHTPYDLARHRAEHRLRSPSVRAAWLAGIGSRAAQPFAVRIE